MNLIRKGHRRSHRGVIGVESAIVMIAFVIVAAALAFVVLNMGFSTTQKAKTTITSGLSEASSSLEVAGKVFGSGDITTNKLKMFAVPIKVVSGGESVDLSGTTTSVKYLSNSITYDNIYLGTLTDTADDNNGDGNGQWNTLSAATDDAVTKYSPALSSNPITGAAPTKTKAFIYWTVNANNNNILDQGEHAVLAIAYQVDERPTSLDKVHAEILVPTGAALTVERQVPSVTTAFVDMG
jgi:flagellin FlaB